MLMLVSIAPLVAAPFVGSFLGVVITRLPVGETVVRGRSRCPLCGTTLAPLDLIPIVSWMWNGGKCRHCRRPLEAFYPAVEIAALAIAVMVAAVIPPEEPAVFLFSLALGWMSLALAWIDARCLVLPDALTGLLTVLGLVATAVIARERLLDHAVAALGGYLALIAVAAAYRALRRRPGLGGGDPKLMAAAGAWVGLQALPTVLLIASVATLLLYTVRAIQHRSSARWRDKIAFGPGLAMAIWIVWLIGPLECRVC